MLYYTKNLLLYTTLPCHTIQLLYYYYNAILCHPILPVYHIMHVIRLFYPNAPYNTWVYYTVMARVGPVRSTYTGGDTV